MILTAVGLAGLVSYSVCSGSKSIKDLLINEGFVLATERKQFESIFQANKEYLGKYKILDSNQLERFCEDDLNRRVLFKSTYFHEKACFLNIGEKIKKYETPHYLEMEDNKFTKTIYNIKKVHIKPETQRATDNLEKWLNWCKLNKAKPYHNYTKPLEGEVKILCFIPKKVNQ